METRSTDKFGREIGLRDIVECDGYDWYLKEIDYRSADETTIFSIENVETRDSRVAYPRTVSLKRVYDPQPDANIWDDSWRDAEPPAEAQVQEFEEWSRSMQVRNCLHFLEGETRKDRGYNGYSDRDLLDRLLGCARPADLDQAREIIGGREDWLQALREREAARG